MRWLKSIVIVLGILIVLGIVLLGYGFYKKTSEPSWKPFTKQTEYIGKLKRVPFRQQQKREFFKSFGTLSLDLDEGCLITKVQLTERYAYFMIGLKPSCNAVIIVDIKKGVVLGRVIPRP